MATWTRIGAAAALALACAAVGQERDAWDTEAARAELKRLEGTWQPRWVESDGRKTAAKDVKGADRPLVVKGGRTSVLRDGAACEVRLRVDPDKRPKAMEQVVTDGDARGRVTRCIYELDGDKLRVCFDAADGKTRPTAFSDKGTLVIHTFERDKEK